MKSSANWIVRDKSRLLQAVIDELAGTAYMSLESDLTGFNLEQLAGVSLEETAILSRNTIWPKQDFLVIPLNASMSQEILSMMGGGVSRRVRHIQIENDGVLQFAAYDNFDPECLFWGAALNEEFQKSLVEQGILGSARPAT